MKKISRLFNKEKEYLCARYRDLYGDSDCEEKAAREEKTSGTRNYESKIRKKKGGMGDDNGKVAEGGAFYFRHRNDGLRNH